MGRVINGVDDEVMKPGLNPRRETADGLVMDYDVALTLRDGTTIYTDVYRRVGVEGPLPVMLLCGFHGGIPNWGFVSFWNAQVRATPNRAEDSVEAMKIHPLFDAYWESKVPADRFLKGTPNEVDGWPKVRIEVRQGIDVGQERAEAEWPLARTEYFPFYLEASSGKLNSVPIYNKSAVSYDSSSLESQAAFSYRFDRDTELTGYFKLKLWVEAEEADDMDLFAAIQKLDRDGKLVNFYYITRFRFGHAAHGWLRVCHRELDASRSKPYQPVHPHTREERLKPGEIVPVEIEYLAFQYLVSRRRILAARHHGKGSISPVRCARHWYRAASAE